MSRKQRYCKVSEECVRGARFFFCVSFGREIAQSGVAIARSQSKAAQLQANVPEPGHNSSP